MMGKKYDAYAQAAQAEQQSIDRYANGPTSGPEFDQNSRDLQQNNAIANALWREVMEDPQG